MESIKTATRNPHLEQALPKTNEERSISGWFVSRPLETPFYDKPTHYIGVFRNEFTGKASAIPVDVLGKQVGASIEVYGCTTHEAVLASLGYVITAPLPAPSKQKRTPARTHLNTADVDRETGKPLGRKPACGQLNGTRTDRAQTHYTLDHKKVTCQRCLTTKAFAKVQAEELIEPEVARTVEALDCMDFSKHAVEGSMLIGGSGPDFTPYDGVDRKAWFDTLDDHKEFLDRLFKERAVVVPEGTTVEFTGPVEEGSEQYEVVFKTHDTTEGVTATGTFGVRADGSGIEVLDFTVEGGAQ